MSLWSTVRDPHREPINAKPCEYFDRRIHKGSLSKLLALKVATTDLLGLSPGLVLTPPARKVPFQFLLPGLSSRSGMAQPYHTHSRKWTPQGGRST